MRRNNHSNVFFKAERGKEKNTYVIYNVCDLRALDTIGVINHVRHTHALTQHGYFLNTKQCEKIQKRVSNIQNM